MNKLDKYNLRKVILDEYSQIKEGLNIAKDLKINGNFKSITISGMGGSALPADVLKVLVSENIKKREEDNGMKKYFKIYQNRTYKLPLEAYDNSLNIICSYSGNTEETIASFKEALNKKLSCIGISNGGIVEKMCEENGIEHIKVPYPFENFQPRIATGYFVFAIWKILENIGIIKEERGVLEKSSKILKKRIIEMEEQGKRIAEKLVGKTPIIYSTDKFKALAMIWKIKFNENSKTPAFWNYFSELNHNEMVGFTNPQADFFFIILRDKNTHPQNLKRIEVMTELMSKKGMEVEIIDIEGYNFLEKIFSTLYLGDWASYYLALEYNIDPTPVEMVEQFKTMIK
ncbi:MAG TPA: bifunctional phosphoglucose/phosphomannose isomerase [Candidatus Moranbacteria bacterium]|nr:bifunctional phosphoglucose/phosphomannose isomerase [Candidatus Moranbacteria bacterium]